MSQSPLNYNPAPTIGVNHFGLGEGLAAANIKTIAPVHDALMIECPTDEADETIERAQQLMQEASTVILNGNICRTDAHIVHAPSRFMDERGVDFWNHVTELLKRPDLYFDPALAK